MKSVYVIGLFAILVSMTVLAQSNPVPFLMQPLFPTSVAPGGPGFTLTVRGTNFVSGSVVLWNGSARPTTFVSSGELSADISAGDVANQGSAAVTVSNPAPGGGTSSAAFFSVTKPIPTLGFAAVSFLDGPQISTVLTADFNGDNNFDVAVAKWGDGTLNVLLGKGDGSFQPPASYWPIGANMVAGDFNGDGRPDIIGQTSSGPLTLFLNNGDGTFQSPLFVDGATNSFDLVAGDYNRDGNLDIAATNENAANVTVLLGNGDGTFKAPVVFPTKDSAFWITTGDVNNDDNLDLLVTDLTSSSILVFEGNGDGSFQPYKEIHLTEDRPQILAIAELNGDGNLDIVTAAESFGGFFVMLGNGDGTFGPPVHYREGGLLGHLAFGDFNGDGKLDIAGGDWDVIPGGFSIYLGNGLGAFADPLSITTPFDTWGMAAADFNHDGRLDIAAGPDWNGPVEVLLENMAVLSTNSISFDPLLFGTHATHDVTLTNTGDAPLPISSISIEGEDSGDFGQVSNCGASLLPGAMCRIKVKFAPIHRGERTTELLIEEGVGSQSVELSGTSTNMSISPRSLAFGDQKVGTSSDPKTATLKNNGRASVSVWIRGIRENGFGGPDFLEDSNCPDELRPGASCQVKVTFAPKRVGSLRAKVRLQFTGTTIYGLALKGEGTP